MPFLPFDRVDVLRRAGITQDTAAVVAMLEIVTKELKEIVLLMGQGGGGGCDMTGVETELGKIKTELDEANTIATQSQGSMVGVENALALIVVEGQTTNNKLTNINDTLEDIENKLP